MRLARTRMPRFGPVQFAKRILMAQYFGQECAMSSETTKSIADHLTDSLSQLKEMRHYSKTNVEHLTSMWMLFDGDLSGLKKIEKIDDLMSRQGQLHDALELVVADLEEVLQGMKQDAAEQVAP
ncbi:MAG: hypothetical protein ABIR10_05830 [Dokdonella sp.]